MIHSDPSQGCIRCIDYTDGAKFRANLNSGGDACECLPWEEDADIIPDPSTQVIARSGSAIVDTIFDMSASSSANSCKCNTGKFTSTSSDSLMCLECATSAGFLVDQSQLTDCNSVSQCESPRGFNDVFEVAKPNDPAHVPSVLCVCDTSKNFFDNKGGETPVEGCYCNKADNWWTLISGEYVEADAYDSNIDYTDLSHGF